MGAGIKGGGDMASACDAFIVVSNDIESYQQAKATNKPNAMMKLTLFFSRFDSSGDVDLLVNRTSGLILGEVEKKGVQDV